MSETIKALNQDSNKSKARVVLVCPGHDEKIASEVPIQLVNNVYELCGVLTAIEGPLAVSVADNTLLKMLVEYQTTFDIEAVALVGVPGCVYDAFFEQYIWSLDRVSYDALILEASNIAKLEALKVAERPKAAGNVAMPRTVEEVRKLRAPKGYTIQRGGDEVVDMDDDTEEADR